MTAVLVGALIALAGVCVGMRGQGWADHMTMHYRLRRMVAKPNSGHVHCSTCGRWFPRPPPDLR